MTDGRTDRQTDGQTDICDSRVAFATENKIVDIAHILRKVRDRGYSQSLSANNNLTL